MKTFLAVLVGILTVLSVVVWRVQPASTVHGITRIAWVSDDSPTRREQIALFNKLNPQFHLSLDPGNNDPSKIIVQSIGGVGPDVFDCYSASMMTAYVKSGIAMDVTDALKAQGVDVRKIIWPVAWSSVSYDGRVYGFPTNVVSTAMWFNKDILDKCDVPYPTGDWKWKEFLPVAQRLTLRDRNGRITQYGLLFDWWYHWQTFVYQWGGHVFSEDGTRCIVDSPESIAAVQFMHDLVYKYHVSPTPIEESAMPTQGGWGSGNITWFAAGKSAMAIGGRWWLISLRSNKDLRLGAVACPYQRHNVNLGYARVAIINRNSPRARDALQFLVYMAGKDYNQQINDESDGNSPVMDFSYTDRYLHNPAHPEEDSQAVWRDTLVRSVPEECSPFVSGDVVNRLIGTQIDLVKSDQKSAADALRIAAAQVNQEIRKSLERDPSLRKQYQRVIREERG